MSRNRSINNQPSPLWRYLGGALLVYATQAVVFTIAELIEGD